MKCITIIIILVSASANVIREDLRENRRFFLFPGDGDGLLHFVDSAQPVDNDVVANFVRQPNSYGYWLYTRPWLDGQWKQSDEPITKGSTLSAFLDDKDVNVVVYEWSKLASKNYLTAKYGVVALGQELGRFIQWIVSLGASYNNMHLVGFSLGGHIVGNAGRHTESLIRRITALDPAGPLWEKDENRLSETDAQYVEVIHTSNLYGYKDPCGHADFYPNGGSNMPGCWINVCSHSKGYEYMAASVKYNHFYAYECDSLKDAKVGACEGNIYPMGNSDLNKSRSGIFRVNTNIYDLNTKQKSILFV